MAMGSNKLAGSKEHQRVANFDRGKRADDHFPILVSSANRELAKLLEDVRRESAARNGTDNTQSVRELLTRAVRCATKQFMLQVELCNLALTDELTGLHNRRGFMVHAERQLRLGNRNRRGMMLILVDVNGLKQINDTFGHNEGDRAIQRTAEALKRTFRDSDVLARLGGDEFVVLAIDAAGDCESSVRARLGRQLVSLDAKESRYSISLSIGVVQFDLRSNSSIGELMIQVDQSMYEQKRRSKS